MKTSVERFLVALEADGLAVRTIDWYRDKLYHVMRLLSNSPPPPPAEVSLDDLRQVVVALRRRELSPATLRGYVVVIRRFFAWLVEEGDLAESPATRLKLPELPDAEPRGILLEDVRRMLEAASSSRDRALVLFLVDSGARAGEVVGLRVEDVDLDRGSALIRAASAKRHKARTVGLNAVTVEAIQAYLAERPAGEPALWLTVRGTPLTYWGLRQVLRRLADRAGVVGTHNAHAFRHAFVRYALQQQGANLGVLADILGHSSPEVTKKVYGVFSRQEVEAMQRRVSPVHAL